MYHIDEDILNLCIMCDSADDKKMFTSTMDLRSKRLCGLLFFSVYILSARTGVER